MLVGIGGTLRMRNLFTVRSDHFQGPASKSRRVLLDIIASSFEFLKDKLKGKT